MTRAWGPLATPSFSMLRRHRRAPLLSVAAVAAGILLLGACGDDDDDDDEASATTTEAPVISTAPTSAFPETTVTTTPATATPTTVAYVTEGASVMVTNASRIDGAAGRMTERLTAVGFTTVEPGNYSLGTLEVTKIHHDPANPQALAVAESLKAAFGGGDIEIAEMGAPPPVDGGDARGATVLVAMGNDIADKSLEELQGIVTTTTSSPETTTAETTESTAATSTSTA